MRRYLLALLIFSSYLSVSAASKNLSLIIPSSEILNESEERQISRFAKDLGKDIKKNWYPREYKGKLRTAIKVSFSETGESNHYINESSGDSSFDQSALAAVDRSSGGNFIYKDLNLEYVFDYRNSQRKINIPFSNLLRIPAKIGAGYAADRLGVNEIVLINL